MAAKNLTKLSVCRCKCDLWLLQLARWHSTVCRMMQVGYSNYCYSCVLKPKQSTSPLYWKLILQRILPRRAITLTECSIFSGGNISTVDGILWYWRCHSILSLRGILSPGKIRHCHTVISRVCGHNNSLTNTCKSWPSLLLHRDSCSVVQVSRNVH